MTATITPFVRLGQELVLGEDSLQWILYKTKRADYPRLETDDGEVAFRGILPDASRAVARDRRALPRIERYSFICEGLDMAFNPAKGAKPATGNAKPARPSRRAQAAASQRIKICFERDPASAARSRR